MSTYAVYGMTRARADEEARQKTPGHDTKGRMLTYSEWCEKAKAASDLIMQSNKTVQLSCFYDMPEPAEAYLQQCKKIESRSLRIKAKVKQNPDDPTCYTKRGNLKTELRAVERASSKHGDLFD